ncbi:HAD-like domain-containing protein [Radiomyces spectabilis]|uniref:HAD-like domain-containing protein n=1 Tax=Radiomyces spectabilis TaxID=64574 RepID=UPI002220557D|nr:HAD-like domain-containing protein [Radiomyces spectabilis]KAI8388353.1 HAD-like domain-containing protein [Radiomyces spectabilis]
MVLTRYQAQRKSNSQFTKSAHASSCEAKLVSDPPLLNISRGQTTDDEATIKIDNLLDQLDDFECSTLDALMARWPSMYARLKGMRHHLPPQKDDNRPTLVLDLDETLLYTTYRDTDTTQTDADYVMFAKDGRSCLAGILRPGVTQFLTWASSIFEVVVWTAGADDYAHMVRECLDPERKLITHMLTRRSCIRMRSAASEDVIYIKDLCALGRDLSKTFLVDNTPHAATLNLSNLIPIEAYLGSSSDNELEGLRRFLESKLVRLTDRKKDMRIILHRQFNLKRRLRERVDCWKSAQQQQQQQRAAQRSRTSPT